MVLAGSLSANLLAGGEQRAEHVEHREIIDDLGGVPMDEAESDRTYSGYDGFMQAKEIGI